MIRASAPGKIILFGEHAVVYGEAAIATAVNKRAYATACELDEKKIVVNSKNLGTEIEAGFKDETNDPIVKAVQESLKNSSRKIGIGIEINSQIPVGVGMGSSAAVTTATACAVTNLLNGKNDPLKIAEIALEAEKIAHGKPSGIDTSITTFGGTINFKRGTVEPLQTNSLSIVVGNTGVRRNTKAMVDMVKAGIEDPRMGCSLFSIGGLVKSARTAVLDNDTETLGKLMDKNHSLLRDLGVSSKSLEVLIKAAKKAGAIGAKLTGAGGGGCIIALTNDPEAVITALVENGATAFKVSTNQGGVRLEQ